MKQPRQVSIFLLVLWLLAAPLGVAASESTEQLLKKAEALMVSYRDSEALAMYEEVLQAVPDNYTALCKASFLRCRMGERITDEGTRIAFYSKAKEYAARAYSLKPADADANYVMALSLGAMAMVSGPKQRLTGINQMKSFLDAALASNSKHADSWHLLARWNYKMANLNFAESVAAKMMFGGVCDEASNQKAIEALQTAIKYNPNNIQYYFDLAMIYKDLKQNDAFTGTLEQALALEVTTRDELELSRRCRIMLQQYQK